MKAEQLLQSIVSGEASAGAIREHARKHAMPWVIIHLVEGSQFATLREQGKAGRQIRVKDIPKMKRKHNVVAVITFSAAAGMDSPEELAAAFSYESWTDEQIEGEIQRLREILKDEP